MKLPGVVGAALFLIFSMPGLGTAQQTSEPQQTVDYISFLDILPKALELDQALAVARLAVESAEETEKASWSGWYPKADITLNRAEQYDVKPNGSNNGVTSPGFTGANGGGSSNQRYNPTEAKLKITQKLWDFGETSATIKMSQLSTQMARIGLKTAKNQSILKAAQTYIGLKKTHAQFQIALDAENQLKTQTGLQDFRVSRGAAVGTDVLQAKNALAAATTARVASQSAYRQSLDAFNTVFGFEPETVNALLPIRVPNALLPESRDAFRELVIENSSQMAMATLAYDMAMVDRNKAAAANFLPDFKLTAEANYKGDAGGTLGGKTEYIAKVEMTWPLELFGTQMNTYRASKIKGDSAAITYKQAKKGVEDTINSTWNGYELASLNRANVQNQVAIAEQFLRLAQIEVQQGRGQMLLVMNAQSALVNARKAFQNNTSDHAVQVYNLLSQTGQLSVDELQAAADEEDAVYQKSLEEYRAKVEAAQKENAEVIDEKSSGTGTTTD